jgi:hypothetical protein
MLFLPPKRAGQGFGIITIMTLLPYAIAPLVLEKLFPTTPLDHAYALTALLMVPAGLLLIPLFRLVSAQTTDTPATAAALPKGSLWINIRQPKILCLLLANGLIIAVFALVFFFLKTFCERSGIGNPGTYFTTATLAMIAVRILAGPLFDRFDKASLAMGSLLILAAGLFLLSRFHSETIFYVAAVLYGIGIGAVTPLLNGLMFTLSRPQYRGFNTNLMLEMVDAGFFLGPVLGSRALGAEFSPAAILMACIGALVLSALLLIPTLNARMPEEDSAPERPRPESESS